MANYKQIALAAVLVLAGNNVSAFQPNHHVSHASTATTITTAKTSSSSTQLHAVLLPPMIISGAIKKYQKQQAEKRMPMASREEAKGEAPGLRVGAAVWKWPPIWPYDREFFMPTEDIPTKDMAVQAQEVAGMLSGIQQPPEVAAAQAQANNAQAPEKKPEDKLNVFEYWGKEKVDVKTEMDEEAIQKIQEYVYTVVNFYCDSRESR